MSSLWRVGRIFYSIPSTIVCPKCHQNNMHVVSLSKLTQKWGRKKDVTPEVKEIRAEITGLLRDEFSGLKPCKEEFHCFFVDPGPGQMQEFTHIIPEFVQHSNPGFSKEQKTGEERRDILREYLKKFREHFLKPVLEEVCKEPTIRLTLSPRHLLFDGGIGEQVIDTDHYPHRRDYNKEKISDVVPIMPSFLEDNSDWVSVSLHFALVIEMLKNECRGGDGKVIEVYFGSGNINIRSWLYALNGMDLEDIFHNTEILDFIARSNFYDYIYDPKSQPENEIRYEPGYHGIPSRPREFCKSQS